jgi:hypothetical protein
MLVKVYSMLSKAIVLFAVCGLIFAGGFFAHADQPGASGHDHADFAASDHDHSQSGESDFGMSVAIHCGSEFSALQIFSLGALCAAQSVYSILNTKFCDGFGSFVDPPPPRTFPIPI